MRKSFMTFVCLIGFAGTCTEAPMGPPLNSNGNDNDRSQSPEPEPEPTPDPIVEPSPVEPPVVEPPIIEPPAPPPLPPIPPTPEPEPEPTPPPEPFVEAPLRAYTCEELPTLTPTPTPGEDFVVPLTEREVTYYWDSSLVTCEAEAIPEKFADPYGPGSCEQLVIGSYEQGLNYYQSIFKFPLDDWPAPEAIETVTLRLYPLRGNAFLAFHLGINVLWDDWWQPCPHNPEDWWPICDEDIPRGNLIDRGYYDHWTDWVDRNDEARWFGVDITEPCLDWLRGLYPNYGLSVDEIGFLHHLVFAGPVHPDETLRPYLVVSSRPGPETLHFPLAGGHENSHINSLFGDWWEEKRCLPIDDEPGPRLRHTGVDYRAAAGDPVYATFGGVVKYARRNPTWGGYLAIEHNETWTTTCTHVYPTVSEGARVRRGQAVGTIAFGNANFGPHLHFQVLNEPFDRLTALRGRLPDESCEVDRSPYSQPEPAFPGPFIDPECLDWE